VKFVDGGFAGVVAAVAVVGAWHVDVDASEGFMGIHVAIKRCRVR
jgi:hypothetical protein